jgi:uncharacterized membrane protein
MAKKTSIKNSKNAEECPCACCRWHSSHVLKAVLAIMFVLVVIAFLASIVFSRNAYFGNSILSLMGVVFLIVFIGWVFGFFCSCKHTHLARHGYVIFDDSKLIAKKRYAMGEITKKQYDSIMKDIQ